MKLSSILALGSLAATVGAAPTQKRWWTSTIDLGYSLIQGFHEDGLNKYYGIRYASKLLFKFHLKVSAHARPSQPLPAFKRRRLLQRTVRSTPRSNSRISAGSRTTTMVSR